VELSVQMARHRVEVHWVVHDASHDWVSCLVFESYQPVVNIVAGLNTLLSSVSPHHIRPPPRIRSATGANGEAPRERRHPDHSGRTRQLDMKPIHAAQDSTLNEQLPALVLKMFSLLRLRYQIASRIPFQDDD
jgi:hypothetical protein